MRSEAYMDIGKKLASIVIILALGLAGGLILVFLLLIRSIVGTIQ